MRVHLPPLRAFLTLAVNTAAHAAEAEWREGNE